MRPPVGQAWTPLVLDGQDAENRGITVAGEGPEGPLSACRCKSISEAVARVLEALDEGSMAEVRALLERLRGD